MKTLIKLALEDQILAVKEQPTIAAGGVEENEIKFTFSEQWAGYTNTAIFYRKDDEEGEEPYIQLISNNSCAVPAEVTADPGTVIIGVFGVSGVSVRTSTLLEYTIKQGTLTNGVAPAAPTQDIYQQLLNSYAQAQADLASALNTMQTDLANTKAAMSAEVNATVDDLNNAKEALEDAHNEFAPPIIQSASGKEISVSDSSDRAFRGMKIYGRTEQVQTTGKQLLINEVAENSQSGITFTRNGDGSITIKGTATKEAYHQFDDNNDIPFRNTPLVASISGSDVVQMVVGYYLASGQFVNRIVSVTSQSPQTFSYPDEAYSTRIFLMVPTGATVDAVVYPLLRLASIADDTYEPYTGGKPSPSPEYPQEIESVGRVGNLIPYPYVETTKTNNGVTFTDNKDGSISVSGVPTSYASFYLVSKGSVPQRTFTLAINVTAITNVALMFRLCDSDANTLFEKRMYLGNIVIDPADYPTATYYELFIVRDVENVAVSGTFSPVLTEGSTALPYRPYNGGQREVLTEVAGVNLINPESYLSASANTTLKDDVFTTTFDTGALFFNGGRINPIEAGTYTFSLEKISNEFNGALYIYNADNDETLFSTYIAGDADITFTAEHDFVLAIGGRYMEDGSKYGTYSYKVQLVKGSTALPYEPYKPTQSLITTVPNGLNGIPVASGGNYTDENGQAWVCDEIDYDRGVYIQRIKKVVFNGTEVWSKNDETNDTNYLYFVNVNDIGSDAIICDKLISKSLYTLNQNGISEDYMGVCANTSYQVIYININPIMTDNTVGSLKSALNENNLTVYYPLVTPIETPLTDEEIAAYKALHTNYHTTVISNDCNADMDVNYVTDTKIYIDNKFAELAAAILNNV